MSGLFSSGRIIDLILLLLLLEVAALALWRGQGGRGLAAPEVILNLLPGAMLLLALRQALTGARWQVVALCMGLSGLAHLADLGRRLRGG